MMAYTDELGGDLEDATEKLLTDFGWRQGRPPTSPPDPSLIERYLPPTAAHEEPQ